MTAEIAIVNKEAIALAADSAVTMAEKRDKRYSLQQTNFLRFPNIIL